MVAQAMLIAALAWAVALRGAPFSPTAWVVGLAAALITNLALARGISYYRAEQFAPADWVTLVRASLAVGVAALVADSFEEQVPLTLLVPLVIVALVLDAVDGWVARRTSTGTLGARFDGEVDAFLILVLSIFVTRTTGVWVLAIGAARYAFLAAGWPLRWLRATVPPRYWRKVVCATQGIVLTIAAAHVLPRAVTEVALLGALVLLAESFGRDVWWLRSRRNTLQSRVVVRPDSSPATPPRPGRRRMQAGVGAALTILALLFVWFALVAPNEPIALEPGAFLRLPLEGLVLIAAAALLPAKGRRVLVWVVGPLLALLVLLKLLDITFFTAFDRPFDPYQDLSYAGIGTETLRASIGHTGGNLVIALVVAVVVGLFVLMTLAVRRLTTIAAGERRWSLRAVTVLGAVWLLCLAFGAQLVSHAPIASTSAAGLVAHEVSALRAGARDHAVFAKEISHDPLRNIAADRLLTSLRGKDVILAFVESYGQAAVQGSSFSPAIDAVLDNGSKQLQAAGFSARSAFLTSPTFGGISWLAHSTMQAGLWVNGRRRYDQLMQSNRFTLSHAFNRAGWRTVDVVPANDRDWAQASSFYGYDQVYDRRNVGYLGPSFAYAPMPDQYVFAALQRLELAKRHRRNVFAEVDMVSSHTPWTRIPRLIPWRSVGDGSVFKTVPVAHTSFGSLYYNAAWAWLRGISPAPVRAAYAESIKYSLSTLISFVQHRADPNLVLIVLGDHQPWGIVSGRQPSHEVPISIIAHDPAVLRRISGWGWNAGLRPRPQAPVWPMSAFRDRFLGAFGSKTATGSAS
jgi:phosphatidylglycerophosphate synthase